MYIIVCGFIFIFIELSSKIVLVIVFIEYLLKEREGIIKFKI